MNRIVVLALSAALFGFGCDRADDGDPNVVSGATPKEDVVKWEDDLPDAVDDQSTP